MDVGGDIPVYRKMEKLNLLKLAVSRKYTYRIKEEIVLPGTKESIGQVLLTDVGSRKLDIRLGPDEILLRGELQVFCMYLSAGEKADWIEQSVPFEGRISCEGAAEGMYHHIRHSLEATLVDVRLDEDGEVRILRSGAAPCLRSKSDEEEEPTVSWDRNSR